MKVLFESASVNPMSSISMKKCFNLTTLWRHEYQQKKKRRRIREQGFVGVFRNLAYGKMPRFYRTMAPTHIAKKYFILAPYTGVVRDNLAHLFLNRLNLQTCGEGRVR